MPGVRPKQLGDEICSCQGFDLPGFSYFKTVKKDGEVYYYPRFRHFDQSIEDHEFQNWGPSETVREFRPDTMETTVYSRKGAHTSKVYPVVIFDTGRLASNLEKELKKSGMPIVKLEGIYWFLKRSKRIEKRANEFLSKLCKFLQDSNRRFIITYGEKSLKEADRISKLFKCDMTCFTDKFGILRQAERKITTRDLQKKVYNYPSAALPDLVPRY